MNKGERKEKLTVMKVMKKVNKIRVQIVILFQFQGVMLKGALVIKQAGAK